MSESTPYIDDILASYPGVRLYADWINKGAPSIVKKFSVASALIAMSSCIAATRCSPIGDGILAQYICLIAGSGIGKRRYLTGCQDILEMINPVLISKTKPRSDVGMTRCLRESPAQCFFYEEFSVSFENMMRSNSSQAAIAEILLYGWDGPKYIDGGANKRKIESTDPIEYPVINLFTSMTRESYTSTAKLKSMKHDGLGGRIEPIIQNEYVEPNLNPDKFDPPTDLLDIFEKASIYTIQDIKKHERTPNENDPREYTDIKYRKRIPFKIDDESRKKFNSYRIIFSDAAQRKSGIEAQMLARTAERIMRTACLLASFDSRDEVIIKDLEMAYFYHVQNIENALPHILISGQDSVNGEIEERVIQCLKILERPSKWSDIVKVDTKLKHFSSKQLNETRESMVKSGRLKIDFIKTTGRPQMLHSLIENDDKKDDSYFAGV